MPLPATGPISLGQIAAEFGGAAPHGLNEYYGKASGIPTSGTISFSHFRGKANKSWTFLGAGPTSSTGGATFPVTAQAGDLAIWCNSTSSGGMASPPTGWSLIASGSSSQAYKICTGGETSAGLSSYYGSFENYILLFRPSGGTATLYSSATDKPISGRNMTTGTTGPYLLVGIGNYHNASSWEILPSGLFTTIRSKTTPSLALLTVYATLGASQSTGNMYLTTTVIDQRQTFGIWRIA